METDPARTGKLRASLHIFDFSTRSKRCHWNLLGECRRKHLRNFSLFWKTLHALDRAKAAPSEASRASIAVFVRRDAIHNWLDIRAAHYVPQSEIPAANLSSASWNSARTSDRLIFTQSLFSSYPMGREIRLASSAAVGQLIGAHPVCRVGIRRRCGRQRSRN